MYINSTACLAKQRLIFVLVFDNTWWDQSNYSLQSSQSRFHEIARFWVLFQYILKLINKSIGRKTLTNWFKKGFGRSPYTRILISDVTMAASLWVHRLHAIYVEWRFEGYFLSKKKNPKLGRKRKKIKSSISHTLRYTGIIKFI